MNKVYSPNPILVRTRRRLVQAGVFIVTFYLTLIGGFVLGVREYYWRVLTLTLLSLLVGGWLLNKARKGGNPSLTGLETPLFMMLGASALATWFSTDPRLSAGRLGLNLMLAISLYATLDWIKNRERAELLINALLLTGGVVCVVGLIEYWQWYGGNLIMPVGWREVDVTWTIENSRRIRSVLHNPNYLAYYLILPIALAFYKLFTVETGWRRMLWSGYLLMAVVTSFLTQSRGGLLGVFALMVTVIGLFLWSRLSSKSLLQSVKSPYSLLIIVILGLGWLILLPVLNRTQFDTVGTLSLRDYIWLGALEIFKAFPLFGAGPATFPAQYMIYRDLNGFTSIFTHAHNVGLTLAAEYGLAGLISVTIFFLALARWIWLYLRQTPPTNWSPLLLTGIALLAGQGTHNLVDDFMEFPIFTWFTVLGVALCLEPRLKHEEPVSSQTRKIWLGLVGAGVTSVICSALWYQQPFAAYDQARFASEVNDWPLAVHWLEQAVSRDSNYHFYQQQLALAYGELSLADPNYLAIALAQQKLVYQTGHDYSPDAAYLGCLYWQQGQPEQAITAMQEAIATTPRFTGGLYSYHLSQPTFYFNLGYYLEAKGELEPAREAYWQVLNQWPQTRSSSYWQMNSFRRQLLKDRVKPVESGTDEYQIAVQLLAGGNLTETEKIIKRGVALSSSEAVPPYYYLWGQLAEKQGNPLLAAENYERAIAASETIRTDYANLVAQRQPLVREYPFCLMMPYPAEYLSEPTLALARLKLAEYDLGAVIKIYQNLLRYEPYHLEVQQELIKILNSKKSNNP
jgi:O-antigen ligase/tetratricopeptide (TPR) repeat protein